MQITRQTEYAIHTIMTLCKIPSGQFIHTKDISNECQIPEVFLKKIVQALSRNGLIITQRGSSGGIRLAKSSDQITIADVLVAIEGPVALNVCFDENYHCKNEKTCQVRQILKKAQSALIDELSKKSFAEILN